MENRSSEAKIKTTIQRIEQTIKVWRTINYLGSSQTLQNLRTIDIPEDNLIKWNDIKAHKSIKFKKIDDTDLIDNNIAKRNIHHFNQTHGYPFTTVPLEPLIEEYSFTTFIDEILKENADTSSLKLSPTIKAYFQWLKLNEYVLTNNKANNPS